MSEDVSTILLFYVMPCILSQKNKHLKNIHYLGAELSRLILAQAGVSYEDYRLPREDWPSMKPSTNFKNHTGN